MGGDVDQESIVFGEFCSVDDGDVGSFGGGVYFGQDFIGKSFFDLVDVGRVIGSFNVFFFGFGESFDVVVYGVL